MSQLLNSQNRPLYRGSQTPFISRSIVIKQKEGKGKVPPKLTCNWRIYFQQIRFLPQDLATSVCATRGISNDLGVSFDNMIEIENRGKATILRREVCSHYLPSQPYDSADARMTNSPEVKSEVELEVGTDSEQTPRAPRSDSIPSPRISQEISSLIPGHFILHRPYALSPLLIPHVLPSISHGPSKHQTSPICVSLSHSLFQYPQSLFLRQPPFSVKVILQESDIRFGRIRFGEELSLSRGEHRWSLDLWG